MKKLSKKRALDITARLWNWIADQMQKEDDAGWPVPRIGNTVRLKADWPGWKRFDGRLASDCPCCQYANDHCDTVGKGYKCDHCPVWGARKRKCLDAEYSAAKHGSTWKLRVKAARKIARMAEESLGKLNKGKRKS